MRTRGRQRGASGVVLTSEDEKMVVRMVFMMLGGNSWCSDRGFDTGGLERRRGMSGGCPEGTLGKVHCMPREPAEGSHKHLL